MPPSALFALLLRSIAGCSSGGDVAGGLRQSGSSAGLCRSDAPAASAQAGRSADAPQLDTHARSSISARGRHDGVNAATPTIRRRCGCAIRSSVAQTARECADRRGQPRHQGRHAGPRRARPAGRPGKIEVAVRYALVQEGPQPKTLWTKVYRIPVTIADGAAERDLHAYRGSDDGADAGAGRLRVLRHLCRLRSARPRRSAGANRSRRSPRSAKER